MFCFQFEKRTIFVDNARSSPLRELKLEFVVKLRQSNMVINLNVSEDFHFGNIET